MKEKRRYAIYSILKKALPIWFVFLLFLLGKGLSYTEAILLDSFSAAAAMIFEIPSGILADKVSKKKVLVIGEIIITLNYLILLCTSSYPCYILGALLSGIGSACISGTNEAFIYDLLKENGMEKTYREYLSVVSKWGFIGVAIATLTSSCLFDINANLPMLISIVLQLVAILSLLSIPGTAAAPKCSSRKNTLKQELIHEAKKMKQILFQKELVHLFVLYLVMLEIISNINYSTQAYLPELGLSLKYLGLAMFLFQIVSAFGTGFAKKAKANGTIWCAVYIGILLGLGTGNLILVFACLLASRFFNGFIWTVLSDETNQRIESGERATVLSCQGLVADLFPLFIDPVIGYSYDRIGFPKTFLIIAGCLSLALLLFQLRRIRQKRNASG